MSGHKRATVTISEGEYRRLHDAEMRLRFAPELPVDTTRRVSEQVNLALQDHLGHLEERQQQFEWTVQNFQQEIQTVELETVRLYMQRENELYERFSNEAGHSLDATRVLLDEQAGQFAALLEEEHRRRQEDIFQLESRQQVVVARLEDRLESVLTEQERKYVAAGNWLAQAGELARFVRGQYPHEMFAPGQVGRLEQAVALAETNLEEGMPEAALVGGQQAYRELSELRLQLERMVSEQRLLLETCWENAARLLAFAEENQTCPAHDLDGNELPEWIDVNFWTEGDLEKQTILLRELVKDLRERGETFDLTTLRELAEQDLPRRYDQLSETIYQARLGVLNSQLRINIADLVVQALEQQGFSLVQSEYANCDQRNGFSARVRNREQDEIVIQVAPDPDVLGKNELHLISLDRARRDERELYGRSREVAQSLDRRGLQVGEMRAGNEGSQSRKAPAQRQGPARRRQSHIISR